MTSGQGAPGLAPSESSAWNNGTNVTLHCARSEMRNNKLLSEEPKFFPKLSANSQNAMVLFFLDLCDPPQKRTWKYWPKTIISVTFLCMSLFFGNNSRTITCEQSYTKVKWILKTNFQMCCTLHVVLLLSQNNFYLCAVIVGINIWNFPKKSLFARKKKLPNLHTENSLPFAQRQFSTFAKNAATEVWTDFPWGFRILSSRLNWHASEFFFFFIECNITTYQLVL